jgi:hypothetical protein
MSSKLFACPWAEKMTTSPSGILEMSTSKEAFFSLRMIKPLSSKT